MRVIDDTDATIYRPGVVTNTEEENTLEEMGATYDRYFGTAPSNQTNDNFMLQDWLQAEFKNKVYCNVTNPQERRPFVNDFGINVMEISNFNYFPTYIPAVLKQWKQERQMIGQDYINRTIKIKLPGRKNKIALELRMRLFDIQSDPITKIKLIYPEELESIDRNTTLDKIALPIAAIYDNVIWMFWDIKQRNPGEIAIMKYIIDEALKLMKDKYKLQPTEDHEMRRFKQIINQFSKQRLNEMDDQLENILSDKSSHLRDYVENCKREETIVKEKALLNNQQNYLDKKAESAIDYFRKSKKIKSWSPSGSNQIIFIMQNLEMTHRNATIKLPEMKVAINVTAGDFDVFPAKDEDNEVIWPIHPHVYRDGHVCMGNFSTIYPRLIAAGQFNQIADLMIQFLENYNEGSPVCQIWKYKAMIDKHKSWEKFTIHEKDKAYEDWIKIAEEEDDDDTAERLHQDVIG